MINELPLTHFNRKYGLDVFNFPLSVEKTCLFKTVDCAKFCYKSRIWHNVLPRYEDNYLDSLDPQFEAFVTNQIYKFEIKWIRLHTIGDFYSEEYYQKWVNIAQRNPETRILAFTRNDKIDFSTKPANLVIYFSVDGSTMPEMLNLTCDHYALAFQPPAWRTLYEHQEFVETEEGLKAVVCCSRCALCKSCFSGKNKIVAFPITKRGRKTYRPKEDKFIHPYNLSGQIHKPKEVWKKYQKKSIKT